MSSSLESRGKHLAREGSSLKLPQKVNKKRKKKATLSLSPLPLCPPSYRPPPWSLPLSLFLTSLPRSWRWHRRFGPAAARTCSCGHWERSCEELFLGSNERHASETLRTFAYNTTSSSSTLLILFDPIRELLKRGRAHGESLELLLFDSCFCHSVFQRVHILF